MLRRQYSQQEPPTCRRIDSEVEVNPGQRRIQPQLPQPPYQHPQSDFNHQHTHLYPSPPQQHHSRTLPYPGQSGGVSYQDDIDPRYYQASYTKLFKIYSSLFTIIFSIVGRNRGSHAFTSTFSSPNATKICHNATTTSRSYTSITPNA